MRVRVLALCCCQEQSLILPHVFRAVSVQWHQYGPIPCSSAALAPIQFAVIVHKGHAAALGLPGDCIYLAVAAWQCLAFALHVEDATL